MFKHIPDYASLFIPLACLCLSLCIYPALLHTHLHKLLVLLPAIAWCVPVLDLAGS